MPKNYIQMDKLEILIHEFAESVCHICSCELNDSYYNCHDTIFLESDYTNDCIKIQELVQEVLNIKINEECFSYSLCSNCVNDLIAHYSYVLKCRKASSSWIGWFENLTKSVNLGSLECESKDDINEMFILLKAPKEELARLEDAEKKPVKNDIKEANFMCDQCTKPFASLKSLIIHLPLCEKPKKEILSDNRSLTCDECDGVFYGETVLADHISAKHKKYETAALENENRLKQQHKQRKKDTSKCKYCFQTFDSYDKYVSHKISHYYDKRPFLCVFCGQKFARASFRMFHIKLLHMRPNVNDLDCSTAKRRKLGNARSDNAQLIECAQ